MVGDVVEAGGTFKLENCTYEAPEGKQFKGWAVGAVNATPLKQAGEQITITADTIIYAIWEDIPTQHVHNHGTIWVTDENEHWNECACGDKANKAAHNDGNADGKCDVCDYQMPNGGGLPTGAVIGIVAGSSTAVGVGGFAIFWFLIKKKRWSDLIALFKR